MPNAEFPAWIVLIAFIAVLTCIVGAGIAARRDVQRARITAPGIERHGR